MDVKTAGLLPEFLAAKLSAVAPHEIVGRMVPDGVEPLADEPSTIAWAKDVCRAEVARNGVVVEGNRTDERVFHLIGTLLDGPKPGKYISIERLPSVLHDFWDDAIGYDDWFEKKINDDNAGRYQNEPGCGPAIIIHEASEVHSAAAFADAEAQARAAHERALMLYPDLAISTGVGEVVDLTAEARPRVDVVPGLLQAHALQLLIGVGGVGKGFISIAAGLGSVFNRELFLPAGAHKGNPATELAGPMGGIGSHTFFGLLYEEHGDPSRIVRRINGLRPFYNVSDAAWREGQHYELEEAAIMYAHQPRGGGLSSDYTETGYRYIERWQKLGERGHWTLWLDSFFDAVAMDAASKVDDFHTRIVLRRLMRLCKVCNCTIIAPFHASRSGVSNFNAGFSPAFESKLPQSHLIVPTTEGQGEKKHATGVIEWREGPKKWRVPTDTPLPLKLRFERDQLVKIVSASVQLHEPQQFDMSTEGMASRVTH